MKLVSFRDHGQDRVGILFTPPSSETLVVDAAAVLGQGSANRPMRRIGMVDLLDHWEAVSDALETASADAGLADTVPDDAVMSLDDVELLAPVPRPRHLTGVGLNYRDHAKEAGVDVPGEPLLFGKHPSSVVGPSATICLPEVSDEVDFEAELAVIIGKGGRDISEERALDHVAGYTCCNDVSARDWQARASQWIASKSFATFAPLGPCMASARELGDPQTLDIGLRLNGETMQQSNTGDMIFSCAEIVSYISRVWRLEPGDVISTGTPAGVGFSRIPPVFLRPGDTVEIEVSGIGVLRNPVTSAGVGQHGSEEREAPPPPLHVL